MAMQFDTMHEDQIHDAKLDYYGNRLATCSSDRMIKVFELGPEPGQQTLSATIGGHEGPVWEVAWAHPKFGVVLASCSYDRKVYVWRESQARGGQWTRIYEFDGHSSSVNSICFAPHEHGLRLACASADGTLSVLTWQGQADNSWSERTVAAAHQIGCNSVSWAPAVEGAAARMVSGGCDGVVRVWTVADSDITADEAFDKAYAGSGHSGWIRDVAWAPSSVGGHKIATCGEDKSVMIWQQKSAGGAWTCKMLPVSSLVVWRVSWSVDGSVLATTAADGATCMYKEGVDGEWKQTQTLAA